MDIILQRLTTSENGTFGVIIKKDKPILVTLELPWKDNQRNISCIPAGQYKTSKVYSPKFDKELYILHDVPDRDFVEIHIGNTIKDTQGCILVGLTFGFSDYIIGSSRAAFNSFMYLMPPDGFNIIIKDVLNV